MTDELCRQQQTTNEYGPRLLLECSLQAGHEALHEATVEVGGRHVRIKWVSLEE